MTTLLSDLDGVLVDSHGSVWRAWRWFGERHGVDIAGVQQGRPSSEVIPLLAPHADVAEEARLLDELQAGDTEGVIALPGARELLERDGPVAIVTSCTHALAHARLAAAGLPIPDVLVTADRLTRGKPDPEGYLLAARTLGAAPEECIVFEDAPAGIAAGRAAGMHVVGITTTHDPAELDEANELVASVAAWLARRSDGRG